MRCVGERKGDTRRFEYLLVESQRRAVERFRRTAPGLWLYQRYAPDDQITLETIGLACPIGAFYRRTPL